jgi:hypothetical protein
MYRGPGQPMPHLSTPSDITTINYTLEWPYLENPSNTTFVGQTQIDICRCPRSDLPPQDDKEPGHIYTRDMCLGPEVRFSTGDEELWVLQVPQGPINMLRPATIEERTRRKEIHDDADPTVYAETTFLFLTGPCPRGRYQAYATQKWLESLSSPARQYMSSLSLLIQPYEEDCSDEHTRRAYRDLTEYILQNLPGFQRLSMNIWDNEMRTRSAACEFERLLLKDDVEIVVGCGWCTGQTKRYSSASAFLEAMSGTRHSRLLVGHTLGGVLLDGTGGAEVKKEEEGLEGRSEEDNGEDTKPESDGRKIKSETPDASGLSEVTTFVDQEVAGSSDEDWTDAVMSPISPQNDDERDWHIL